jgi:hypothetical protein
MFLVYFQCFLIPHPETAVFDILESFSAVYFAVCLSVCRKPNGYHCFTASTLLPFFILVTVACQKLTTVNVLRVFCKPEIPQVISNEMQNNGSHLISCHFEMTPDHVILVYSGFTVALFHTSGLIYSFFCLLNCFKFLLMVR